MAEDTLCAAFLRDTAEGPRAQPTETADCPDLDHAVLRIRTVERVLKEVDEDGGLGGEVGRILDPLAPPIGRPCQAPVPAAHAADRSFRFLLEHRDEDLDTSITRFEISRGMFDEVIQRYEPAA